MAAAGGHLQRPAAGSRGSAGAGEGPGAAVGGFDPHLLEAGGGGRSGRRRALVRGGGEEEAPRGVERATEPDSRSFDSPRAEIVSGGERFGKLRAARGPRTKLEKSKQAAAAGEPPSFPSPRSASFPPWPCCCFSYSHSRGREEGSALASGARRSTSNFCFVRFVFSLSLDHGEPGQQLAAAPGDGRLPLLEALRRLRGQDCGPLSALCHGQLLAQPLPQVLLLPGAAGRHRHVLLHQERHDPLQK